jgi:hypothetical protein
MSAYQLQWLTAIFPYDSLKTYVTHCNPLQQIAFRHMMAASALKKTFDTFLYGMAAKKLHFLRNSNAATVLKMAG